jgi:hypothetical protein
MSSGTFDSLQIILENLRFLSDSNLNAISSRTVIEWTVYISLITFFGVIIGSAIKMRSEISKFKPWLKFLICFIPYIAGAIFCISIFRAHYKNAKICGESKKQIIVILEQHRLLKNDDAGKLLEHPLFEKFSLLSILAKYSILIFQEILLFCFFIAARYFLSKKWNTICTNSAPPSNNSP